MISFILKFIKIISVTFFSLKKKTIHVENTLKNKWLNLKKLA